MQIYRIFLLIFLMFLTLFVYCFYEHKNYSFYEGMNNEPEHCISDKSERALVLALKNTASIASINKKIKSLSDLNERFSKIENTVKINHKGIQNLTNQLSKFTTSLGNKK